MEKCGHLEAASGKKRSYYAKFTPEQKAEVGCRAAEHGVASTIRHYASQFTLKETYDSGLEGQLYQRNKEEKNGE